MATIMRGSPSGQIRMSLEVPLQRRITINHQVGQLLEEFRECNLVEHSQVSRECSLEVCSVYSLEVCNECSQVESQGSSLEVVSHEYNLAVV